MNISSLGELNAIDSVCKHYTNNYRLYTRARVVD
jgi:hypothetical protein